MTDTYESLRESAGGTAGEAWRAADRAEANLRALYQELKDDPRYTEEHKAATAWERYEAAKDKITADKEKARELLQKQLRSAERLSVPLPGAEAVNTTDTDKLLASQNEATRLVRRIDRLEAGAKGPFKPDRVNVLKEQYQRGLEVGGVQGGAICRGVLLACEELGVNTDAVVDPFRKQTHRDSLEHAQHVERLLFTVGGKPPEPPFPRPGRTRAPKDVGTYGGRRASFIDPNKDQAKPLVTSQHKAGNSGRRRSKAPWK
jgi:hypothetical protein